MLLTFVNTICTNAPEGAGLVKRLIFMWWPANQQETLEVVRYDFGKTVGQGVFEHTGRLNRPHQMLLTAISGYKWTICP